MPIVNRGVLNEGMPKTSRAISHFPAITPLADGSLLAAYCVSPKKDSAEETIELRRSTDLGQHWTEPWQPFDTLVDGIRGSLRVAYVTPLDADRLMVAALWIDRETYPGQPLFNEATEGCLPMRILIAESTDLGLSWTPWRTVDTPGDVGPPSLTNPILKLPSGRLVLSIESNKQYEDASKWCQKVTYLYSGDEGRTWGDARRTTHDPTGRYFNWDQRAGVTADGQILTFTWLYDSETKVYQNIQRRRNSDEGATWTDPEDLGVTDQPSHPAILADGRVVLAWVDRFHSESIRARLASGTDQPFTPESEVVLYEHQKQQTHQMADTGELLGDMGRWTFGLPFCEALPNGEVMIVYYGGDLDSTHCYWARLAA